MKPDVVIIGAGPAGSVAAAMLANAGLSVEVLERAHFPRFSIGESLLPQAMEWLDEAGLLQDVVEAGFQHKNGAVFRCGEKESSFDFRVKTATGWGTTYQVRREILDDILARGAARAGARVTFGQTVVAMRPDPVTPSLTVRDEAGVEREIHARFILDASGFGRVLARLLDLETPVPVPQRMSIFTHVADRIPADAYDRNKILITVNPGNHEIWYWMIPLAGGITSMGVVGRPEHLAPYGKTREEQLYALVAESGLMAELLGGAPRIRDVGEIAGYACKVSRLTGQGYALLGNAGEFLDPVFSSGVTIALKSASLASKLVIRQLEGETPDWDAEFVRPLSRGIETFRAYVNGWYDGALQTIVFKQPAEPNQIKAMITSVLAGYAWDEENPFVREPVKYLGMVGELCR
ncbi:MAG: NAD(P)/FAD-dependent oxidoreductase [Parvibaculum sp.]|jgi:flavin-dependent dehydrogenase|uniref:NAD(P)/FAD-dependent oxidoreductase n=1 Tax=Parvibaculum sp. TaxID=2024848 RepID=UPI002842BA86|nr:NAD(P)/FAD-dependent oxidoreductase [Parvibaculum sp.]MDR3500926.1 NAD(P)/FAD-dependent oxidoreductase [Parvibaculum sp.]